MIPPYEEPLTAKSVAPFGLCPICRAPGLSRERGYHGEQTRFGAHDHCANGHSYLSIEALPSPKQ